MLFLLFLLAAAFGAVFIAGLVGSMVSTNRKMGRKDGLLDELFPADAVTVTWNETVGGLPAETVIDGAYRRGFEVVADDRTSGKGIRHLTFASRR